jgi:hypothetical protein
MPEGVNDTTIVLIPKKDDPADLKDFRPISLCNAIFKVVSKCLVNLLCPLLQEIIAPIQSAFILGCLITDNALIAFECIHWIQTGPAARRMFCANKLDMAKAYDRVDWRFLEGVLAKLGFHSQWVQWVMACVTTVRYTIRFNGNMLDSLLHLAVSAKVILFHRTSSFLLLMVCHVLSEKKLKTTHSVNSISVKEPRAYPTFSSPMTFFCSLKH